jgi:carbon-monoxide dehydrogenase iron sulfur subunit
MVCPYGAIQRDLSGKKAASKCDLCAGKERPVCVMKCPNEALEYREG